MVRDWVKIWFAWLKSELQQCGPDCYWSVLESFWSYNTPPLLHRQREIREREREGKRER